ncbi:hypothetical protein KP79_PYT18749 [Mizuhopecten yessoensis]|uniref:PiggyBac transposable element-derived protein 4 C-terminal zinc-finger domain-containing protein n=2 Tax=Mizuhopecten yessoensis TaxID=6573 RepID=A0A210Q3J1_MIZYE|nr:hypothetical protein KP79_PYT18749 [Mizuhopecten yessoensis]
MWSAPPMERDICHQVAVGLSDWPDALNPVEHQLVRVRGINRACGFCRISRNKTKQGYARKSYYECQVCAVPLCRGNCFERYHELVNEHRQFAYSVKAMYKMLLKKFSYHQ